MIDIEKIKRAALAATQSTWAYDQRSSAIVTITKHEVKAVADFGACSLPECEANATFIATANPSAVLELIERLEAAEQDATKWHEYQAKKKVLADRGFGKSPLRDAAMKESK